MGADGTIGIGELKKAGCHIHVIGQDKESCVVYGMPRALAEAGLADEVVPLNKITETIIKNVGVM
jgi:two-component system chemotaxis response regulator CheB